MIFVGGVCAFAQNGPELDAASLQALQETTKLLQDPKLRNAAIANDPKSQYIDNQVRSIGVSSENAEAIYKLSADVMDELVRKTGGDATKMIQILEKAKNNPKNFAESLSPEFRAKLKELSKQIPASAPANPTAK